MRGLSLERSHESIQDVRTRASLDAKGLCCRRQEDLSTVISGSTVLVDVMWAGAFDALLRVLLWHFVLTKY